MKNVLKKRAHLALSVVGVCLVGFAVFTLWAFGATGFSLEAKVSYALTSYAPLLVPNVVVAALTQADDASKSLRTGPAVFIVLLTVLYLLVTIGIVIAINGSGEPDQVRADALDLAQSVISVFQALILAALTWLLGIDTK